MLRKLLKKDAPAMLECMRDVNVNQYMKIDGSKMTLDDCITFIDDSFNDINRHFAIVDKNDNWCGTISLKNIDREVNQAEYAIITSSAVHGKGLALDATKELLDYAFNELALNRIYLNVADENVRANKFYLKCGFKFEGCFRQALLVKGKLYDLNWYSLIKGIDQ